MTVDAFPLSWPAGYPRTKDYVRSRARFRDITFASARDRLMTELARMSASKIVLSTNIPLRGDGLPYANRNRLPDPGVAVYFTWRGKQHVIACDRWDRIESNLHAIELTVEAMRGLERWGCTEMLERALTGFAALPPPPEPPKAWHEVLGVAPYAYIGAIEEAYRSKAKRAHPDCGGSTEEMSRLNLAIEQARAARGR